MSQTREILTFQFGNYANYVGAHWWNIQEASFSYEQSDEDPAPINHDVLYRQGVGKNNWTTFTPRLLLVDLDGALKHLPVEGELYGSVLERSGKGVRLPESLNKLKENIAEQQVGAVELHETAEIEPHAYQQDLNDPQTNVLEKDYQLADTVDSWADYLYARFHPRTVNIVNEYKHAHDKHSFDTYTSGTLLWRNEQFEEDFCDRIRQYVEECDYLQGFQTLFDCDNGFGGLATKCMEYVSDEYGKANLALPLYQPRSLVYENADEPMSDTIRIVNSALTFHQLIEQSSLFAPLSTQDRVWRQMGTSRNFRSLHYKSDNLYQTSAILAAYLETITLRYRLRGASLTSTLGGFCNDLSNYGRKMSAAAFALPFDMQHDEDLIDCLDKHEGSLFTTLTPNCKIGTDYVVQTLSVRGIPENRLKRPREHVNAQRQSRMAAYRCDRVSEMFQLYLQCSHHASMAHVSAIATPMATALPYPNELFVDSLNSEGYHTFAKRDAQQRVNSVPTLAAMQSSGDIAETLETLHREANRVKVAKLHRFKAAGLESDDYQEALEQLLLFKDNYEDNYEL